MTTRWTWTNSPGCAAVSLAQTTHNSLSSVARMVSLISTFKPSSHVRLYKCVCMHASFVCMHRLLMILNVCVLELTNKSDIQSLLGNTLSVTSSGSAPSPAPATDTILCPYVNLQLCNSHPSGKKRNTLSIYQSILHSLPSLHLSPLPWS